MIKKIVVLPYLRLYEINQTINITDLIISVRDPGNTNEIPDRDNVIKFHFWDWDPNWKDNPLYLGLYDLSGRPYTEYFNESMAADIIDFVDKRIDPLNADQTLYINCEAGISRSGAIGSFFSSYLGLSYDDFKRDNPRVYPNAFVLAKLNRVVWKWNLPDSFEE